MVKFEWLFNLGDTRWKVNLVPRVRCKVCFYPAIFFLPGHFLSWLLQHDQCISLFIIVKKEAKNIKHYYHCEKENTKGTGNQCRIKKCKSFSSLVFIQVKCFFYGKYPTKKSRKTQWKINQPSDVFFENPVIRSWRYRFHWVCYRGVFISRACLSRARLFNAVVFFFLGGT